MSELGLSQRFLSYINDERQSQQHSLYKNRDAAPKKNWKLVRMTWERHGNLMYVYVRDILYIRMSHHLYLNKYQLKPNIYHKNLSEKVLINVNKNQKLLYKL